MFDNDIKHFAAAFFALMLVGMAIGEFVDGDSIMGAVFMMPAIILGGKAAFFYKEDV